jgi:hypothetical protein
VRVLTLSLAAAAWLALGLGAGSASAATLACGARITTDTRLDNDLTDCPEDGIRVGASDITLDLNGHTIDGDASGGGYGVTWFDELNNDSHSGITVRNGEVREFSVGISMTDGGNVVRSVTVAANGTGIGVALGSGDVIEDNVIFGNSMSGVLHHPGGSALGGHRREPRQGLARRWGAHRPGQLRLPG